VVEPGGAIAVAARLDEIENGVDECFRLPAVCDVSAVAAAGSPAAGYLTELLGYYLRNGLVSRKITALRYVVPDTITLVGTDRARVTLCEVDGSWQMDSAGTLDTSDDIVVNDRLVSRRATHELILLNGRWLRWDIVELELWIGENRCSAKLLP